MGSTKYKSSTPTDDRLKVRRSSRTGFRTYVGRASRLSGGVQRLISAGRLLPAGRVSADSGQAGSLSYTVRSFVLGCWVLALVGSSLSAAGVSEAGFTPEGFEFFEKHVRPVLIERCYK